MGKFNKKTVAPIVQNMAGGCSYKESSELELVSLLLTSFLNDKFYEKEKQQLERLKKLISECNPEFVCKCAIYARNEFGMRSVTHVVASEVAKYLSGKKYARSFYSKIVHRVDDITEILAYHLENNGKISSSMKNGLRRSFDQFDNYQIAKYKAENNSVKLIDSINLLRPKPTIKNVAALHDIVKGKLVSSGTWESELSKAGQIGENELEVSNLKKEAWTTLIRERKIGYFALLRNLRNILEQAPEVVNEAAIMLTDEKLIKKSLVLPFRYQTAYNEISKMPHIEGQRTILMAIARAIDISLNNVPKLNGKTIVVLDVSGSMSGKPSEIGSLFSAVLVKSNDADFMTFSNNAQYVTVNTLDSTITIANRICFAMGGTNFSAIFEKMQGKYDNIIILSDMQGCIGYDSTVKTYNQYKTKYSCSPNIYSFDLNGYGTLQFPEKNVYYIAGFSDKIFDVMNLLSEDKNALVNKIKEMSF